MMKRYGHQCHAPLRASGIHRAHGVRKVAMDDLWTLTTVSTRRSSPTTSASCRANASGCASAEDCRASMSSPTASVHRNDASDTRTEQPPRRQLNDCDIHWVDGKLDGSELTMDKACYNMKRPPAPTEDVGAWRLGIPRIWGCPIGQRTRLRRRYPHRRRGLQPPWSSKGRRVYEYAMIRDCVLWAYSRAPSDALVNEIPQRDQDARHILDTVQLAVGDAGTLLLPALSTRR